MGDSDEFQYITIKIMSEKLSKKKQRVINGVHLIHFVVFSDNKEKERKKKKRKA